MIAYMDSGFKNSHLSTIDWPCNRVNAYKSKHTQIDDEGENYPDSEEYTKRDHLQQL